jgi:hypothetical protein
LAFFFDALVYFYPSLIPTPTPAVILICLGLWSVLEKCQFDIRRHHAVFPVRACGKPPSEVREMFCYLSPAKPKTETDDAHRVIIHVHGISGVTALHEYAHAALLTITSG